MISAKTRHPMAAGLAALLLLAAAGCGGDPAFDPSTKYTPESLAQELAFRYNDLAPDGKTSSRAHKPKPKGQVDPAAMEKSLTKAQSKEATKKSIAATVDDVLDEIEAKVATLKGTSPAEVYKKMADAVSKDTTLDDAGRQVLTTKLKELAGG